MNYSKLKFSYLDQLVITINLKPIRPDSVEIARTKFSAQTKEISRYLLHSPLKSTKSLLGLQRLFDLFPTKQLGQKT